MILDGESPSAHPPSGRAERHTSGGLDVVAKIARHPKQQAKIRKLAAGRLVRAVLADSTKTALAVTWIHQTLYAASVRGDVVERRKLVGIAAAESGLSPIKAEHVLADMIRVGWIATKTIHDGRLGRPPHECRLTHMSFADLTDMAKDRDGE